MQPHSPSTADTEAASWRRFAFASLAFISLGILAMPAMNLLVDPYDLFGTSPLGTGPTSAQRSAQVSYLAEHPGKFNTLLLGTSVMGIIDPVVVDRLVPGARAYNFAFFLATASDISVALQALDRAEALPPNVIIGIDPFLFAPRSANLRQEFRFPPSVTGESSAKWWAEALFASSLTQSINKVFDHFQPVPSVRFHPSDGHYELPAAVERLRADPATHARTVFMPSKRTISASDVVDAEFGALQSISGLLQSRGVTVVWYVQPTSQLFRRSFRPTADYDELMSRIRAQLPSGTVDLTSAEGIYDNPLAWHDMKHMTASAGAAALERALHQAIAGGTRFQVSPGPQTPSPTLASK